MCEKSRGGLTSRQLDGRLLSACLTSRCAARILPGWAPPSAGGWKAPLWYFAMYTLSFSVLVPSGGSHREFFSAALK